MNKLTLLTVLLVGSVAAPAQIKRYPSSPFDFQEDYSFDLHLPLDSGGFKVKLPFLKHELSQTFNDPAAANLRGTSGQMPVDYPEMDRYIMPIWAPVNEMDYSLVIISKKRVSK